MRSVLAAVALLALAGVAGAQAQSYPTRAVTIVVPFAAGGPADITGRIVADQFARALGQQFVIENVAGAGGTTGTTRAARANPDGYTLSIGHASSQHNLTREAVAAAGPRTATPAVGASSHRQSAAPDDPAVMRAAPRPCHV